MADRRTTIRNVLSNLEDNEGEGITVTDCGSVSQINVFSGASININVTNVDKSKPQLFNLTGKAELLDSANREKIYRMCHGIAKQYDIYEEMRRHMMKCWQVKSMRGLTDEALNSLLSYMRDLEEQIENAVSM